MFEDTTHRMPSPQLETLTHGALSSEAPIRPLHFGPPSRRLFGIIDEPPIARATGRGVVLCYPHGPDYGTSYRSFRVLAGRLRNVGCRVLRFDYFGTGDSSGDWRDATVEQWLEDVRQAVGEMVSGGVTDVSLVGLRLGATLAAMVASTLPALRELVLWEPVLDGQQYLASLRTLHDSWLRAENRSGRFPASTEESVLADRWTAEFREGLASLNLMQIVSAPTSVRLVWQHTDPLQEQFASLLRMRGSDVVSTHIEAAAIWSRSPVMPDPPVPNKVLQSIVTCLSGAPC